MLYNIKRKEGTCRQQVPYLIIIYTRACIFLYLEARTSLLYARQITVAYHPGFRIIFFQTFQQPLERFFLCQGTGIGRLSTDVQASFVTDTDGMSVVAGGVCAYRVERTTTMHHPVLRDVVVIADVGKATGKMVATAVVHSVSLRGAGGTTMYHYQVDAAVVLVLAAG